MAIPWKLIALDEGRAVPRDAQRYSGLAFMGGPMSANDALPWIIPALALIGDAVRMDVPVLGHCLGGQLMARALGGSVRGAPVKEIGWGEVRVSDNAVARDWLGPLQAFDAFHWHGEVFCIPPGGTRVLENEHCANQAFAIGKHLGMQCHVEMTGELVREWLRLGAREIARAARSPGAQKPAAATRGLERRVSALHKAADRIYDRWCEGISRGS